MASSSLFEHTCTLCSADALMRTTLTENVLPERTTQLARVWYTDEVKKDALWPS
ncbi:hypothetical protein ACP70R_018440 [Stipagrostis hirtigluma subsp. patula]